MSSPGLRPGAIGLPRSPSPHPRHPKSETRFSPPRRQQIPDPRDTSPSNELRRPEPDLQSSRSLQNLMSRPNGDYHLYGLPSGLSSSSLGGASMNKVLLPPPRIGNGFCDRAGTPSSSRPGSSFGSPSNSRPSTPPLDAGASITDSPPPADVQPKKRKGGLMGRLKKSVDLKSIEAQPAAWIIGPGGKSLYDLSPLANSRVPELWDETGDTLVHVFPKESGHGPSFKIHSSAISSSKILTASSHNRINFFQSAQSLHPNSHNLHSHMRQVSLDGSLPRSPSPSSFHSHHRSFSNGASSPTSSTGYSDFLPRTDSLSASYKTEHSLYIPLGVDRIDPSIGLRDDQIENLVAARNLFAFLTGQPLVGTQGQPTLFGLFWNIAKLLEHYEFSNMDGSNFGEIPTTSFIDYLEQYGMADIRGSREKTLEALILGERMKSWDLYNEGFVHAAGKWDEIKAMNSQIFHLISSTTSTRLERASADLASRLRVVHTRLTDFEYPSLFAGVANQSADYKDIDFKAWKASFFSTRKFVLGMYKQRYGSWPPKASSKKNDFEESGLNRRVLREMYQDFCDIYDILASRDEMTTRTADFLHPEGAAHEQAVMPAHAALRKMLGEFDRSDVPVQPPIPFDVPMIPDLSTIRRGYGDLAEKQKSKERNRKLKDNEVNELLLNAVHGASVKATPFIEAFFAYERAQAHGKSIDDITDIRIGQWIFMYAVIQSLPLVVVDAPGLRFIDGVEYFLCEVPKGSTPWIKDDRGRNKAWYGVAGGSGVVNLPAHVVDHGVEGIFRRSHCWKAAEEWTALSATPYTATFPEEPFFPSNERVISYQAYSPHASIGTLSAPPTATRFDEHVTTTPPPALAPDIFFDGDRRLRADESKPLPPPPRVDYNDIPQRPRSNSPHHAARSGLEQIPLLPGVVPAGGSPRRVLAPDPSRSFDAILSEVPGKGRKR
ncbi:hypothetical protein MMC25_002560 [Agyrium rufum]|nr:hypothetical protein [Agyrium rufum]